MASLLVRGAIVAIALLPFVACKSSSPGSSSGGTGNGGTSGTSGGPSTSGGTSGGSPAGSSSSPGTPPRPAIVDVTHETMQWKGNTRIYVLAKPKTYDASKSYPLVLSFHGNPADATYWSAGAPFEAASGSDAVIAYPQALLADGGSFSWDLYTPTADNADMDWIQPLIAEIKTKLNVDTTRVLGFGYSGGAFFISQYGCRFGGVFKAISINAGGGPDEQQMGFPQRDNGCYICPGGPVATIVTHGQTDPEVPLDSGQFTAACYASTDGCGDGATATTPAPCELVDGCPAATPVKRCFIPNQGHGLWDGAMAQAWAFFKALP